MNNKLVIGIDFGATNYRLGVVTADGRIKKIVKSRVGKDRSPEGVVDALSTQVQKLQKDWPDVSAVGIGIPGIVDCEDGIVYKSPHYPLWVDVNFKKLLSDRLNMPVIVDNDANMIALGELWLGAGKGLENFIMITLGTGIGGGIVCNRKVWHGDHGFAGEIGHILINFSGPRCDCGSKGCWEMYSSATGIKQLVMDADDLERKDFLDRFNGDYDKVSPEVIYDLAKDGDIFASVIWKKFGAYLGAGLASLINVLGITNIVIGGGVSKAWDFFINVAEKELRERTYKKTASFVKIHKALLGDKAGILGSADAFFSRQV